MASNDLPNTGSFVTVHEAANFLGVSERHVYTMCANGSIKAIKLGKLVRINRAALLELAGMTEPEQLAKVAE